MKRLPGFAGPARAANLARLACLAGYAATATLARAEGPDGGMSGIAMGTLAQAKLRFQAMGTDLVEAPAELQALWATASSNLMSGAGVRAVTYVFILFLIGTGVEWLYWTYTYPSLRFIDTLPVASPRHAFMLGLRRLALMGFGLLLFAVSVLGASSGFAWPPGVQHLVIAATLMIVVLRLAWLAVVVVLAPGHRDLRLVPVPSSLVPVLAAAIIAMTLLVATGHFVPDMMQEVADTPHAGRALRFATVSLAALLLLAVDLSTLGRKRHQDGQGLRRRLPKIPPGFLAALVIIAVYGLWLMAGPAAATLLAIVALVVAAELALRDLVFFFWKDDIAAQAALAPEVAAELADPQLVPSIVLSFTRLVVVLLGLGASAVALDVPMLGMAMDETPLVRFGMRLLGVAALALLANVVWISIKSTIDHRLRLIGPVDPHAEPGPNARLLTLLPLLRITAAVTIGGLFGLSALWALGIEVTPLLAGAGVVGLAIGFGAQALVRDIIAGIFLLAEDVFRVGEYIESGSTTKGTVERITLRTVALRHHNGPLHFVPFGALGVVRNNSRDWVVEKFNLPLPITVDSEKIRKMIKKIGEGMMQDEEIGHLIRAPLKGKLYRIDPGLKIFRCSFQTAPGMQFDVRAAAYKRIEAGMKELGVSFADGRQVLVQEGWSGPQAPAV